MSTIHAQFYLRMQKKLTVMSEQQIDIHKSGALPLPSAHVQRRAQRVQPWMVSIFIVLLFLIVVGSVVGIYYSRRGNSAMILGDRKSGFIQQPLNAQQVNDIHHLVEHMKYKQLANLYVQRMTLDEEIGQLLMVEYTTADYSTDLDTMIHDLHVGGVIMYASQISTAEQTRQDTRQMQERATFPLLISVDEEGWNVTRMASVYGRRLSADDMHRSGDTNVAAQQGQKVAQDMLALGINTNLAPDVDVSPQGSYIDWDNRAFGDNVNDVIKYAGPYLKAMQSNGAIGVIKHFPGIGGVSRLTDPHAVLPTIDHTKEQIYDTDMAPFKYFTQLKDTNARAGVVMPTNVMLPAIDPVYPAELSHTFITDILRKEFNFDGVILTDALEMDGVRLNDQPLAMPRASVLALQAGDDMLLGARSTEEAKAVIEAIKGALQDGTLTKQQIDASAARILALKMEHKLMIASPPQS